MSKQPFIGCPNCDNGRLKEIARTRDDCGKYTVFYKCRGCSIIHYCDNNKAPEKKSSCHWLTIKEIKDEIPKLKGLFTEKDEFAILLKLHASKFGYQEYSCFVDPSGCVHAGREFSGKIFKGIFVTTNLKR